MSIKLNKYTITELNKRYDFIYKNFEISNKPLEDVTKTHKELFKDYVPDKESIEEYKSKKKLDILLDKVNIINSELEKNRAGEFRPDFSDWGKIREFKKYNVKWDTFYSALTKDDYHRFIDSALKTIDTIKNTNDIKTILSSIEESYHKYDFLHTFYDGNSRTGRTYFNLLLRDKKILINWNFIDREDLYVCRDISLSKNYILHGQDTYVKNLVLKAQNNINNFLKRESKNFSLITLIKNNIIDYSGTQISKNNLTLKNKYHDKKSTLGQDDIKKVGDLEERVNSRIEKLEPKYQEKALNNFYENMIKNIQDGKLINLDENNQIDINNDGL